MEKLFKTNIFKLYIHKIPKYLKTSNNRIPLRSKMIISPISNHKNKFFEIVRISLEKEGGERSIPIVRIFYVAICRDRW